MTMLNNTITMTMRAMVLACAVGAGAAPERPRRHALGAALLVVMLLFSSFETIRLLLDRYYLA